MLSIRTFGTREEGKRVKSCGRLDELSKLQELKSLAEARRTATAGELGRVNHLQLERLLSCSSTSRSGGIGRPRSFRALATRAFGGFRRPRPSFRETVPHMAFLFDRLSGVCCSRRRTLKTHYSLMLQQRMIRWSRWLRKARYRPRTKGANGSEQIHSVCSFLVQEYICNRVCICK